jgi:hypothetical protein
MNTRISKEERIYNYIYALLNFTALAAMCAGLFTLSRLGIISVRVLFGVSDALFHGSPLKSFVFGVVALIAGMFLYSVAPKWAQLTAKKTGP